MSEGKTELQQPLCTACGRPHLPTRWERAYLCPSCGKPLQPLADPAHGRRPALLRAGVGIGALLILGGGIRLAAEHLSRSPQNTPLPVTRPAEAATPVTLPQDFEARLAQKLELLREDLRIEPANPGLLQRLAETHLLQAMLFREQGKADLEQGALQRARRTITRLHPHDPQAAIDLDHQWNNFGRLVWGEPRSAGFGSGLRIPRSEPGASSLEAFVPRGDPGGRRPLAGGEILPAVPSAPSFGPGQPPPALPEGVSVGAEGLGRTMPPPPASSMPLPLVPGASPSALSSAEVPDGSEPTTAFQRALGPGDPDPERERLIRQVKFRAELLKVAPAAMGPVLDLAKLYETLASVERRIEATPTGAIGKAEEKWLRRAIEVYVRAAGSTQLRSHRATLYDYAADMHARLHEWEAQYQLLRKALDAVPTSPRLWRKFQAVCLLTGRRDENLQARQQYQDWSFPSLVFRDL